MAPRLVLSIDTGDTPTSFDQLVFIPGFQDGLHPGDPVPVQGPVVAGSWQSWNALVGGWQSLFSSPTAPLMTLQSYLAAHPSAHISTSATAFAGLAILAGCDGAGLRASVDAVAVATGGDPTVFDFELVAPPITDLPTLGTTEFAALIFLLLLAGLLRARHGTV
jgi:hypothetical protein